MPAPAKKLEEPGTSGKVRVESSQPGASGSYAEDYIQIIVTGPQYCGKSSLVCSYMGDALPPEGSGFLSKQYLRLRPPDRPVMIWDLDSRPNFEAYRLKSYPQADVAILCYDIKKPEHGDVRDPDSLSRLLDKWHKEIVDHCKEDIEIVLVGLKKDLRNNDAPAGRFFGDEELNLSRCDFRIRIDQQFWEVSALENRDVTALFQYAIRVADDPQPKPMQDTSGLGIAGYAE